MNQPDVAAQINVSRERLDAASGALNALAADANRETLRNTASAVGSTLIATAGDDVLWGVLSPEQPAGNLNAVERAQLRTVLTTNWVQTLEDLKLRAAAAGGHLRHIVRAGAGFASQPRRWG
jgi:hypothetical protein